MEPLSLHIENRFTIEAPLDAVWNFLKDPSTLSSCLPGIEGAKQVDKKNHTGLMKVKIAQIEAQFLVTLVILEEQASFSLLSRLHGVDSKNNTDIDMTNSLLLQSLNHGQTEVYYRSDGAISGKLVALGGGFAIRLKAIQMGNQFSEELKRRIEELYLNTRTLLQRHEAFWRMETVQKPLLSLGRYYPLQPRKPIRLANGEFTREGTLISPNLVDAQWLVVQQWKPSSAFGGDFIPGVAPYDLCWTEAILGCPILWSQGFIWSEPFLNDWRELDKLRLSPDNPWLSKLLEITSLLAEQAQGRYPVCQPLMRGPIDMATAALGDERALWAVVDERERENFRQLLEICTDIFIIVAKAWQAVSPPFCGGGNCEYGLWAPGTMIRTQADNASLISPELYGELLSPCDERILEAFDYPLIHTHSGWLRIGIEELLKQKKLAAIQVSLDYPAGPDLQTLLPLLKRINSHKPLIITGPVTQSELDLLLNELSPNGLCLQVALREEAEEGNGQ